MSSPNPLFVFTDEQRSDTPAAYGNTRIEMPNLSRLAAESVVFDQTYVTQPVCAPSRAAIMTGLCTPVVAPRTIHPCLPTSSVCPRCSPTRTMTGYHGKWHLGDEILQQHGFQDWMSIDDGYARYYSSST